jgi:hypothetical protein
MFGLRKGKGANYPRQAVLALRPSGYSHLGEYKSHFGPERKREMRGRGRCRVTIKQMVGGKEDETARQWRRNKGGGEGSGLEPSRYWH